MRVHRTLTVLCLAGLLVLSAGCGSKGNKVVSYDAGGGVSHTLSFFGNKYEAANVEVIEEILNGYMEENTDIVVSYESLKGSGYYEALKNREASGQLDDIFMINRDTALAFEKNGSLADLTNVANRFSFSESMLGQMRSADGKIYRLPTIVSAFGLYCNLDLLKAYGQSVPENLDEWREVCDVFVEAGITPVVANNDISLKTLALARGFHSVYEENKTREVFERINSGEEELSGYLSEGFGLAEEFCEKGYIDAKKALATANTSDDLEEFVQGNSPFMLTGAWAAGRVKRMEPEFDFQVVPYPVLEKGAVLVINPDVCLSVSKESGRQEPAKDFVTYFLEEENISRFADNQASFSPLQDEFEPSLDEVDEIVNSYRGRPSVIGSDNLADFPIWDITEEISKRLLSGEDLDFLMEQMDEKVRNALTDNRGREDMG